MPLNTTTRDSNALIMPPLKITLLDKTYVSENTDQNIGNSIPTVLQYSHSMPEIIQTISENALGQVAMSLFFNGLFSCRRMPH